MARLGKRVYKKALFSFRFFFHPPVYFDMGHDGSEIKISQIGVVIHDI